MEEKFQENNNENDHSQILLQNLEKNHKQMLLEKKQNFESSMNDMQLEYTNTLQEQKSKLEVT
jgi:hypothetical protein